MFAIMAYLTSKNVPSPDPIEQTILTRSPTESITSILLPSYLEFDEYFEEKQAENKNSNDGVFTASILDGGIHFLHINTTKLSA